MRNLKRVLALVLALTMVLSFAISASAGAFTDVEDDDDYASAINLLASLEVLKGFEDGTYNSAGSYTREQFAKILYVLVNGKDDNAAMYQGTAPFPDVAADRWSAGYITWAVNLGICNGRDDGNFWPTDIVKYAEACKMFLIAMGYSSTMYTYPYGFIDKAQTLKMFDDVKGYSTFGEANRGTVAQMAYNALFAEAPRFGTYTAKEGDATTTETKLLIMGAFGVTYEYSILKGTSTNAYDTGVFDEGQVSLAFYEKGEENNTQVFYGLNGVFNYDGDVDDLIGVTVKVWHKADENELNNIKVYMIEDSNRDKVYTVNPMDVDTDRTTGSEVGDKVKDTKYTLYFKEDGVSRKLTVYKNGTAIKYDGTVENFPDFTASSDDKDKNDVKAKTYKAVDLGNDGVVDYLYVSFPQFGKVTSLTSSKISVTALSGDALLAGAKDLLDDDDNVIITVAEGVAKDDYALVYAKNAVVGGASETVYDVVKAETVSEVKYNRESGTDRYFGGTAYKVMGTVESDIKLGGTYTLYLNANGYVGYADEIDSGAVGSWILVTDAYNSFNTANKVSSASLVGYLADGTKKTLYINLDEFDTDSLKDWGIDDFFSEDDGWDVAVGDGGVAYFNKVFTYTTDDDGYVDSLKVLVNGGETFVSDQLVTSVSDGGVSEYNPDKTQLTVAREGDDLKSFVTSKTVIYNIYDGASKVVVLKDTDLPEYDKEDEYNVTELGIKDGEAAVVVINSDEKLTASNDKYALVISADKYAADTADKYYYVLTVATGGEIVELTTKDVEGPKDLNAGLEDEEDFSKNPKMLGYFKLVVNSSGKVTDMISFDDEDNAYTLDQGVVTSIPNSKGFEMAGTITYGTKTENGVKNTTVVSAAGEKTVVLYADTVGFYTIDSVPVADVTEVANDEDVSAATQASLIKSSVENLAKTTGEDLLYVVDVICNDDGEVVETFIFTTPVEGGGVAE